MKIVLASKSPRRIELLTMIGVGFTICEATCDEICEGTAIEQVMTLALRKAQSVATIQTEFCLIVGADTLVACDEVIFGKPQNEQEAYAMLRTLSDRWHWVHTGVALVGCQVDKEPQVKVSSTRVHFIKMTDQQIEYYVQSGECMDKAGAYGIQGRAGAFIDRIEGDYYTVVGLPICLVQAMLTAYYD